MTKVYFLFVVFISIFLINACSTNNFSQGEVLYKTYCADCHMDDGSGLEGLYPPLDDSDYLKSHFDNLPCIIKNGMSGSISVNGIEYDQKMDGFPKIMDNDINNIINFMNAKFLKSTTYINIKNVQAKLKNCN